MIQRFKTKPNFNLSKVEAIQFKDNAEALSEISSFIEEDIKVNYEEPNNPILSISTPSGIATLSVDDYIVKTEDGSIWNSPKDSFENDYEIEK